MDSMPTMGDSTDPPAINLASRRGRTREWLRSFRNGWVARETVTILQLSLPIIGTNFFYQIMFTIALVFVGHISSRSLELDAAALALSFANVTGVSVGIGVTTAAETLCSQMFGFKNFKGVGVVTQRGIWILGLTLFPVVIVWLNTESLLLLIQQDPCVARLTGLYVQIYASCLPALYLSFVLQKYLIAQSIVLPFIVVGIVNNVISAALHGVLLYWADLGITGSAIAISLSTMSSPIILLLYIRFCNIHRQTWGGWSFEGLRGWDQYVRLGIPGLLMLCFEWWCYELAAFVMGSISKTQLAIYTVTLQILSLNFMLPYGVGTALTVRVGNELGAGNPVKAKQATYTAFGMTVVQTILVAVILLSTKNVLGRIFSRDEEVISGVAEVVYVIVPIIFSDSFQGMMQGVLKGTGKQLIGAVVNFISFYIIGFPVGTVLAIVAGMGVLGMWIGLLLASVLQCVCYVVLVLALNWEKESELAKKRASSDGQVSSGLVDQEDNASLVTIVEEEGEEGGEGEGEGERVQLVFSIARLADSSGGVGVALNHCREDGMWEGKTQLEEIPLVTLDEEEEDEEEEDAEKNVTNQTPDLESSPATTNKRVSLSSFTRNRPDLRLVLSRVALYGIGAVCLVLGGVASNYHPHTSSFDYCECDSDLSGNGTGEWGCGNGTTSESVFQNTSIIPSQTLMYMTTSSLIPSPTPNHV